MFLLSSENFFQAFKRMQYMKQYTQYRKEQGEQIMVKTDELTQLNVDLTNQRKEKDQLIATNNRAKAQLMKEMKSQKDDAWIEDNRKRLEKALEDAKKHLESQENLLTGDHGDDAEMSTGSGGGGGGQGNPPNTQPGSGGGNGGSGIVLIAYPT